MTLAEQLLSEWKHRGPVRQCALRLDPKVLIFKNWLPDVFGYRYIFSDMSSVRTTGKGKAFRMQVVDHVKR